MTLTLSTHRGYPALCGPVLVGATGDRSSALNRSRVTRGTSAAALTAPTLTTLGSDGDVAQILAHHHADQRTNLT